jgi:hypothetical protein
MIPYKPYVRRKHVESILGTRKNMTKKVFNFNNTIPHSARLVNPYQYFIASVYVKKPSFYWTNSESKVSHQSSH